MLPRRSPLASLLAALVLLGGIVGSTHTHRHSQLPAGDQACQHLHAGAAHCHHGHAATSHSPTSADSQPESPEDSSPGQDDCQLCRLLANFQLDLPPVVSLVPQQWATYQAVGRQVLVEAGPQYRSLSRGPPCI